MPINNGLSEEDAKALLNRHREVFGPPDLLSAIVYAGIALIAAMIVFFI